MLQPLLRNHATLVQLTGTFPFPFGLIILGSEFVQPGGCGIPRRFQCGVIYPRQQITGLDGLPQFNRALSKGATHLERQRCPLGRPNDTGKAQRHALRLAACHLGSTHRHRGSALFRRRFTGFTGADKEACSGQEGNDGGAPGDVH